MTPEARRYPESVPEDILDALTLARTLAGKERRTRDEEETMNRARIRIAFWACRREGLYANWENLSFVLGEHAAAIRPAYDRMLAGRRTAEAEKAKAARRRDGGDGAFWDGGAKTIKN